MANTDLVPNGDLGGTSYLYNYGTTPNTRTAVSQKIRVLSPHYGTTNPVMNQMGVLGTLNPSQSRAVEPVRGIGFGDKIAEIVPGVSEPTTVNFERALLYLCNLWQALGYAAGVDGPVRSLSQHRWPFDIEMQLVFSSLADRDLGVANIGTEGTTGNYNGGLSKVQYPLTTAPNTASTPDWAAEERGHSILVTMFEACWLTSWGVSISKDAGALMETGDATCSDVHDFSSTYGEFLATGNDPTVGQLGSIRFGRTAAAAGV